MLKDLVFVFQHVKKIIEEHHLAERYAQYASTLDSIDNASTNELQEQLKEYRHDIKLAHDAFDTIEWSYTQLSIVKKIGFNDKLGEWGMDSFKIAHRENQANTPGAVEDIKKLGQEINQLLTGISSVLTGLGELATIEEQPLPEGNMTIELVFDEKVSINTVKQWNERSEDWKLISHAAKLLDPRHASDLEIKTMSKNTPLITEICGPYLQVAAVGGIFYLCLQLYEKVLKIARLHLEISRLEKQNEQERIELEKRLEEKETAAKTKDIELIVKDVFEKYGKEIEKKAQVEATNAVTTAVKRMYEFVRGGGELRYRETAADGEAKKYQIELPDIPKLNNQVKRFKESTEILKLLEAEFKKIAKKKEH